jgi:hypothetical protein
MIQQRSFNNQSTTWRFSPVRTVRIMVTVLCAKVVDVETVSVGGRVILHPCRVRCRG